MIYTIQTTSTGGSNASIRVIYNGTTTNIIYTSVMSTPLVINNDIEISYRYYTGTNWCIKALTDTYKNNIRYINGGIVDNWTYNTSVNYSISSYHFIENLILEDNPLSFELQDNLELQANFVLVEYQVSTQVNPSGYGTTTGGGYYQEGSSVTLTATPNLHKVFVNWTLNGTIVSTSSNYTFTMGSQDVTYVANFDNAPQYDVNCKTNPENVGSIWRSTDKVWHGESVTLKARDEKGYSFVQWSTGQTSQQITITNVQSNVNVIAYYKKAATDIISYEYRAYIKDQLYLNQLPKAFVTVKSFTIRRDLLTSANSSFDVVELPDSVNEGDVFVLINPLGKILYYGIISALSETNITTRQIQSFFSGTWVYDNHSTTSLEAEVAYLLGRFATGYQKNCSYQDILMNQEKSVLAISTGSTTTGKLATQDANTTMDFEDFIYSLYSSYNLVFDFTIPYHAWNAGDPNQGSVVIRNPSSSVIKIANNADCIIDISPTTEVTDVNKLIIYSSAGAYRKTFIATINGIVEEPSTIAGRIGNIKTAIVYSDDTLDAIKAANINTDQFNHKVEFTLLLDNYLYDFWSWELGQTLSIYKDSKYFDSVFTAYEITKEENKEPSEVKITAGKVRNKLTSLLKIGVA